MISKRYLFSKGCGKMCANNEKGAIPMSVTMTKWGNNLGLRIPKAVVSQLNLKEGNTMSVTVQDGSIILKPEKTKYTLEEMVQRMEGQEVPGEIDFGVEGYEQF